MQGRGTDEVGANFYDCLLLTCSQDESTSPGITSTESEVLSPGFDGEGGILIRQRLSFETDVH